MTSENRFPWHKLALELKQLVTTAAYTDICESHDPNRDHHPSTGLRLACVRLVSHDFSRDICLPILLQLVQEYMADAVSRHVLQKGLDRVHEAERACVAQAVTSHENLFTRSIAHCSLRKARVAAILLYRRQARKYYCVQILKTAITAIRRQLVSALTLYTHACS